MVLTTNDDATNIFLAVYCRRLNPDTRIVSRITHERNLEAIHRAGADFVLSYTTLAVTSPPVHGASTRAGAGRGGRGPAGRARAAGAGGSGADRQRDRGADGSQRGGGPEAGRPRRESDLRTELAAGLELVMLGNAEQLAEFRRIFG